MRKCSAAAPRDTSHKKHSGMRKNSRRPPGLQDAMHLWHHLNSTLKYESKCAKLPASTSRRKEPALSTRLPPHKRKQTPCDYQHVIGRDNSLDMENWLLHIDEPCLRKLRQQGRPVDAQETDVIVTVEERWGPILSFLGLSAERQHSQGDP